MMRWLRSLALTLGVGFVLFAISERVFWSFWRDSDDAGAMIGGWLIYSLFGYLVLAAGRLTRAGGAAAWVMLGALFGWLVEGAYAMTLYGDPSMPFPFTLAWTGLAWHAMLSVGVGLVALRRCLAHTTPWPTLGLGVLIAAFWGVWGWGWSDETPPQTADPLAFFIHAAVLVAGIAAAQVAISFGEARQFAPSRIVLAVAAGLVTLFFAAVTVPALPWAPVVLLPLLALVLWRLRSLRDAAAADDAVDGLCRPIRNRNLAALASIPPVATAIYAALLSAAPLPVHVAVAGLLSLVGTSVFVAALFRLRGLSARQTLPLPSPQHR